TDGTITTADGGANPGTLSRSALQGVGSTVNISIAATDAIVFNNLSSTLALQTGLGNSAAFTTSTGAITFADQTDTLSTAGGSINFIAGTNLAVANFNTASGDVSLTAGATDSGDLSARGILTAGSGNITFQATNTNGGTITQSGVASGLAINATATGNVTVDSLRGTTVGLTSNTGSVNSLGG